MKHLTQVELVDFVEGALPAGRADHVEACDECRRQADDLRAALNAAVDVEMPEPSPLFWNHFSARVCEAVAAESDRRSPWSWLWRPAVGLPLAAALVVLTVAAVVWRGGRAPAQEPAGAAAAAGTPVSDVTEEVALPSGDESWDLVAQMAATLEWEDAEAAGFSANPGSADRAVLLLTAEERAELARLLSVEAPRRQM